MWLSPLRAVFVAVSAIVCGYSLTKKRRLPAEERVKANAPINYHIAGEKPIYSGRLSISLPDVPDRELLSSLLRKPMFPADEAVGFGLGY